MLLVIPQHSREHGRLSSLENQFPNLHLFLRRARFLGRIVEGIEDEIYNTVDRAYHALPELGGDGPVAPPRFEPARMICASVILLPCFGVTTVAASTWLDGEVEGDIVAFVLRSIEAAGAKYATIV